MNLYAKDVAKIGFKGSGLFDDSKWYHFYYAELPKTKQVYIIDSVEESVSHFNLSDTEWKEFKRNVLSLVPPGCCCASGNKYKEYPILDFKGDFKRCFKTLKNTLKFISNLMKNP